jgi:hypothetical protein
MTNAPAGNAGFACLLPLSVPYAATAVNGSFPNRSTAYGQPIAAAYGNQR